MSAESGKSTIHLKDLERLSVQAPTADDKTLLSTEGELKNEFGDELYSKYT